MNKDYCYIKRDRYGATIVDVYRKRVANRAADLTCDLIARWGMVAGLEDGEDSSGRAKLRLATPKEMVKRACDTAEMLIKEIEKRDWYLELPSPQDLPEENTNQTPNK